MYLGSPVLQSKSHGLEGHGEVRRGGGGGNQDMEESQKEASLGPMKKWGHNTRRC